MTREDQIQVLASFILHEATKEKSLLLTEERRVVYESHTAVQRATEVVDVIRKITIQPSKVIVKEIDLSAVEKYIHAMLSDRAEKYVRDDLWRRLSYQEQLEARIRLRQCGELSADSVVVEQPESKS